MATKAQGKASAPQTHGTCPCGGGFLLARWDNRRTVLACERCGKITVREAPHA